jgi:hypothetical protein
MWKPWQTMGLLELDKKELMKEIEVAVSNGRQEPTLLLLQQTVVQSTILFLIRTVDKILQTCSVVKNQASTAATIQTDMAVSDIDA